ncbi:g9150 [Coccomyxa elongata]
MTVESKQAFFKEIITYLGAKDEAQMASILKAATGITEIAQVKSVESHQGADCQNAEGSHHSSDSSSEESSEESAEKSGKKRAAANGIPDKRGKSVQRTPRGGKKSSTEETSGTSRGAEESAKRAKKSIVTTPAGEKSIATPPAGEKAKNLIDPVEFENIIAVLRNQLFNDSSVSKEEYIKLQQENGRLATECKRAQDLAASRQAALEEYTSLLSRMNAVTKPK